MTPTFQFGCKRVLVSDDYWATFERDDVELVTDSIERIEAKGVRTNDGALHEADVIVLAQASHQFGHDPVRVHAAGQHVAVVAVGGDNRVLGLLRRLDTDDDRLLADIEVTEAANQPHAVHLTGLLLEPADQ